MRRPQKICSWSALPDLTPQAALVANVDLVIVRDAETVSVLYGRCPHRGAMLADGHIDGKNLICGVHHWDFRFDTGVSEYNNSERLHKFTASIDLQQDAVLVDLDEIEAWAADNPQPYQRDQYLGQYADLHGDPAEPHVAYIQKLSREGLSKTGHHGVVSAMGVPRQELPEWDAIQILTAQLDRRPLDDHADVGTELVIGPRAKKPLVLKTPILISDMSFGALSAESKIALSRGAEMAGTGICSGEGGMLEDERAENSRYLYELASGKFGWSLEKVKHVQAFHFKSGQGAKTGTGGHLPGDKVQGQIAQVRGIEPGQPAISPSRFAELATAQDYRKFADQVREESGGIPIGFKISAQHIERDMAFALAASADYVILDGRGGGTGAAPNVFKNNISIPTIPALARARRFLQQEGVDDVTLIITGGLRTESDFLKALALGADGVAIANSAMQAIGCLGMRACETNHCPVGIATQKENLRARLKVQASAKQLERFLTASTELMRVIARACGHSNLSDFSIDDLTTFDPTMNRLSGIPFAGDSPSASTK